MTQISNTAVKSIVDPTTPQSLEKIPPGSLAVVLGFFPIIAAMYAGYRVVGQLVPEYRHPEEQVRAELDPNNLAAFIEKRKEQQRGIVHAATQYIRFLLKNPLKPTRLELIS